MTIRSDNSITGGERSQTLQVPLTLAKMGITSPVPASSNVQSNILPSNGYLLFALGVTSVNAGSISIQRFVDLAGNVPQGVPITASLIGGTAQVCNITNDGYPFQSMQITITNTGGSTSALTNALGLWQSAD